MASTPDDPLMAFSDLTLTPTDWSAPPVPASGRQPGAAPVPRAATGPAGSPDRGSGPAPALRLNRLPLATAVAVGWAAVVSLIPVFALVALGGVSSGGAALGALRLACAGWLLGHGVPIRTPGDQVTLIPLALLALVLWRLARAGVQVSRALGGQRSRSLGPAALAGLAVGIGYALVGMVAAIVAATPDVTVSVGGAAWRCGAVATIAAGLGAAWRSRSGRRLIRRAPPLIADAVRAGLLVTALILAAGAGAAGLSLALHGGDAAAVLGGFRAGVIGQAGITLACLAFAPNAAVWATAYLIGPGFAVGVGTTVSPSAVLVGPVPALPLLPGVPAGAVTWLGPVLLAAPLVAAMVAGSLLARKVADRPTRTGWGGLLGAAAIAAPIAGLSLAAAAWLSAGGLGSGRLAVLGPPVVPVGLWGVALAFAGLVVGAAATRLVARPRPAH